MNPDIITSAPRPEVLQSIAAGSAPSDLRVALDAIGRLVRSRTESLARSLIVSIAGAPPLRALEAFLERRFAGEEVSHQAAEAAATARILRVRARLTVAEQQRLDVLLGDEAIEQTIAMILRRSEDEALEILRRQLGTLEPAVSAASLARQVGAVRGELTNEEYDRVIMRLPHLSAEQQESLHSHLAAMMPPDAAMLLRSYLRPERSVHH